MKFRRLTRPSHPTMRVYGIRSRAGRSGNCCVATGGRRPGPLGVTGTHRRERRALTLSPRYRPSEARTASPDAIPSRADVCRRNHDRRGGPVIGIGGRLAAPPLPHHLAYGSRTSAVRPGPASTGNIEAGHTESPELVVAQGPLDRHVSGHAPEPVGDRPQLQPGTS